MDPEHAAVLLPLLAIVVGGGFALLLMGLNEQADKGAHKPERKSGRDLTREHHLGGHKETAAWGCPLCGKR